MINKKFFRKGILNNVDYRKEALRRLKREIKNEKSIQKALHDDLGKSKGESFLTEIHFVYNEINIATKNIKKWTKRKSVRSSLLNFPSSDYIIAQPYGNTLHISPWELSISIIHFTSLSEQLLQVILFFLNPLNFQ